MSIVPTLGIVLVTVYASMLAKKLAVGRTLSAEFDEVERSVRTKLEAKKIAYVSRICPAGELLLQLNFLKKERNQMRYPTREVMDKLFVIQIEAANIANRR